MALKHLYPSDTAFAIAFLSAHTPRLLHAFSTLQPVMDTSVIISDFESSCLTEKNQQTGKGELKQRHVLYQRGLFVYFFHHGQMNTCVTPDIAAELHVTKLLVP